MKKGKIKEIVLPIAAAAIVTADTFAVCPTDYSAEDAVIARQQAAKEQHVKFIEEMQPLVDSVQVAPDAVKVIPEPVNVMTDVKQYILDKNKTNINDGMTDKYKNIAKAAGVTLAGIGIGAGVLGARRKNHPEKER